jgi:signal transduction histidine kinase/ligand-binding sensor domain-containing protein
MPVCTPQYRLLLPCLLSCWLGLLGISSAWAVDATRSLAQLRHTSWTARDGAPSDVIEFAQTADGFLWLATARGLVRFDGQRFDPVNLFPNDAPRPQNLSTLFVRPDGALWIAMRTGGVVLLKDGQPQFYGAESGLPAARIVSFAMDRGGVTWASSTNGLYRLEGQRWQAVGADWGLSAAGGMLRQDQQGALWIANDRGQWFVLRPSARRFAAQAKADTASDLAQTPDGRLWLWQMDGKVQALDAPATSAWQAASRQGILMADRSGSLWLGSWNQGLQRIADPAQPAAVTRRPIEHFGKRQGLSGDLVMALFEDREGNVWVGTPDGLDRFSDSRVVAVAADHLRVGGALAPAEDERVWTANFVDGLHLLSPSAPPEAITLPRGSPRAAGLAMHSAPDGTVWIAGFTGLWRGRGQRLERHIPAPTGTGDIIQSMTQSSDGLLWVSFVGQGLWRLQGEHWLPPDPRLPKEDALSLHADAAGRTWIGYAGNRIVGVEAGQLRHYTEAQGLQLGRVLTLHARSGRLWAGGEAGLSLMQDGHFRPLRLAGNQGLGFVTGIVETAAGELWLNEESGLLHLPRQELQRFLADTAYTPRVERLDALDGLYGSLAPLRPTPSMVEASDGRLWLSRNSATYWLYPDQRPAPPSPPPVVITGASSSEQVHGLSDQTLQLPLGTRGLRITYTALNLGTPEHSRFRYRLEGLETQWQDAGHRREAVYTNLSPGHYRFSVQASQRDGPWSSSAAELSFSVPPAFYQTRWFQALCVLALGLLAWLLHRWRSDRACRRLEERIQAGLAERERIARELHDHLMQGTVGLTLQVQAGLAELPRGHPAQRTLEHALNQADLMLAQTREQVQDLRSHQQPLELGQALVEALMLQRGGALEPQIRCRVAGQVRPLREASWAEAYRIGLEAGVNALRHAEARQIEIGIDYGRERLSLRVADDGCGLCAEVREAGGRPGHWGLRGMRERAALLDATLSVQSSGGGGTEVVLHIKAQLAYQTEPRRWLLWPRRLRAGSARA